MRTLSTSTTLGLGSAADFAGPRQDTELLGRRHFVAGKACQMQRTWSWSSGCAIRIERRCQQFILTNPGQSVPAPDWRTGICCRRTKHRTADRIENGNAATGRALSAIDSFGSGSMVQLISKSTGH